LINVRKCGVLFLRFVFNFLKPLVVKQKTVYKKIKYLCVHICSKPTDKAARTMLPRKRFPTMLAQNATYVSVAPGSYGAPLCGPDDRRPRPHVLRRPRPLAMPLPVPSSADG